MNKNSALLFVILFSVVLSFPWLGSRAFYTRGEPREALVPQKMIETSNWILPRTFDDRVPSKPPFSHWLIGLSAHLKGAIEGQVVVDEWSARFPSALLALCFTIVFYLWIERSLGFERAFHSCCILITSFEWMRGLVTTRVDTVLSVMLGFAILCLFTMVSRRTVRSAVCAILALAAATLTKGPVALVLPAAIIGIYIFTQKRQILQSIQIGFQLFLPALIIACFWYVLAYQEAGDDFLSKFWYENVQRFAGSTEDKPHDHSVFYLALMFFVGLLPWSFLYLPGFAKVKNGPKVFTLIRDWYRKLAHVEQYAFIAIVVIFAFFSIPSSKRGVYLLPAFPFAALLLSRVTISQYFLSSVRSRNVCKYLSLVIGLVITALSLWLLFVPLPAISDPFLLDLLEYEKATFQRNPFSWLAVLFAVAALYRLYLATKDNRSLFASFAGALVAVLTFFQGPIVNGFAAAVSEERLADQLRKIPEDVPLYSYYYEYYGTIFNLHRSVSLVGWQSAPSGVILVKERDYEKFKAELPPQMTHRVRDRTQASVVQYGNRVLIIEFGAR